MEPKFRIVRNEGGTLELILHDIIGDNGMTSKSIVEQLAKFPAAPVNVNINSLGGYVHEGVGIHNALAAHRGTVTVLVTGMACSIASYIAMAGRTIRMYSNTFMMIHDPMMGLTYGGPDEHRKTAEELEQLRGVLAKTYSDRTKQPLDKILKMMTDETWLDAVQSKQLGFCDEVIQSNSSTPEARFDLSTFKAVPYAVLNFYGKGQSATRPPVKPAAEGPMTPEREAELMGMSVTGRALLAKGTTADQIEAVDRAHRSPGEWCNR